MSNLAQTALSLALLAALATAQDPPRKKTPSVTLAPPALVAVTRGKSGTVDLHFRVASGFHINSNAPKSDFLIPTALKINAPTDIVVSKITYPAGEDMSFPFAPDEKLNVYSGSFTVGVLVRPLHNVVPSKYMLRGQLRYQACDNAACYPPKQLPVEFEVKVVKGTSASVKRNPPQSPHVHK
jgi:hypothetical protein